MTWLRHRRAARLEQRAEILEHLRRPQVVDYHGLLSGPEHEHGLLYGPKSAVGVSLVGADLQDSDLRWADLREANLRDADLRGARLDGADLSWADLSGARLRGARFGSARLVETILHGADLTHADLSGVTGLTPAAVRNHRTSGPVRWPPGFRPDEPGLGGPLIHRVVK